MLYHKVKADILTNHEREWRVTRRTMNTDNMYSIFDADGTLKSIIVSDSDGKQMELDGPAFAKVFARMTSGEFELWVIEVENKHLHSLIKDEVYTQALNLRADEIGDPDSFERQNVVWSVMHASSAYRLSSVHERDAYNRIRELCTETEFNNAQRLYSALAHVDMNLLQR